MIGGGSSHQRTRLRPFVPCFAGKYREIRQQRARASQDALAFGGNFNRLPIDFPSRLSRENLRAIREPEAGNSELYPNKRAFCVWRHTTCAPRFNCSRTYRVGAESSRLRLVAGTRIHLYRTRFHYEQIKSRTRDRRRQERPRSGTQSRGQDRSTTGIMPTDSTAGNRKSFPPMPPGASVRPSAGPAINRQNAEGAARRSFRNLDPSASAILLHGRGERIAGLAVSLATASFRLTAPFHYSESPAI